MPVIGERSLSGRKAQAMDAYREFWERRAKAIEDSALRRLDEGDIDRALTLGALAAIKRNVPSVRNSSNHSNPVITPDC